MKIWVRTHLPTWAQLLVLSRTIAGLLLIVLGVAVEHVTELQTLVTSLGAPPWAPTAIGLALAAYARVHDAYSGANPP